MQAADGSATIIGVATLGVNPKDNTVNLTISEGATSTLVIYHLLHLTTNLILIPPQLSHPTCPRMRRAKIRYESFIHFPTLYVPPNVSESECNSQQLALMEGLYVPEPGVLLALADQLYNLRTAPPRPKASNPEFGDRHGTKDKTPKKIKLEDEDTPKKHHKSHKEKSRSKHSPMEKPSASSSHEHDVEHQANRLGDVVAQACLSIASMVKVVENAHNSKMAEALLVRQCLEKVSAEAIDSVMDDVRYHVPKFPHSSATFNIIVGFCIQAFSQSSYKDHWQQYMSYAVQSTISSASQ